MEIRIVSFTEEKAKQFIYQKDQKTKMKQIDSAAMNQYSPANTVVTNLNANPGSNLRGKENSLGLLTNQYAVIKGSAAKEAVKWDGSSYVRVKIPAIKSKLYGTVKPYQGDVYQQMALDSLSTNQVEYSA